MITDFSDSLIYLSLFGHDGYVRLSISELITAKQSVALAPAIALDLIESVVRAV